MKAINSRIDTSRLKKKANVTELGEAYETLERSKEYRVGAGIRTNRSEKVHFFLEIVIPLCDEDSRFDIGRLRSKLGVLEDFEDVGYSLRCEKDNSVICEKCIREDELEDEYKDLIELIEEL